MVIVAHDVNVPAFTKEGARDVIRLEAGTKVRLLRSASFQHNLCLVSDNLFVVVPDSALKQTAQETKTFTEYLRGIEAEPEEGEVAVEEEEEASLEPEIPLAPPGAAEFTFSPSPEFMQRVLEGREYRFMDDAHRFILIDQPGEKMQAPERKGYKSKTPTGTVPRMPTSVELERERTHRETFQHMLETGQIKRIVKKTKTGAKAMYYAMVRSLLDTKTGKGYRVETEADAQTRIHEILAKEGEAGLPEYTPYTGFLIQKVTDPETGEIKFNVVGEEGQSPLNEKPFESLDDAQRHIDKNLEQLFLKIQPAGAA